MATVAAHEVRPGRGAELGLLALALTVGLGAYAIVGLATAGRLPAELPRQAAVLIALAVGMHLVLRWRAPWADQVLLPATVALNGLGLAMIHRIDLAYAARDKFAGFADRQLGWTALGMVFAAARPDRAARPPHAAPLHVHRDGRRPRAHGAAARARAWAPRSTAPGSGSGCSAARSSPPRSARSRSRCSSPATW